MMTDQSNAPPGGGGGGKAPNGNGGPAPGPETAAAAAAASDGRKPPELPTGPPDEPPDPSRTDRAPAPPATIGPSGRIALGPGAYRVMGPGGPSRTSSTGVTSSEGATSDAVATALSPDDLDDQLDRLGIHRADAEAVPVEDAEAVPVAVEGDDGDFSGSQRRLSTSSSLPIVYGEAQPVKTVKLLGREVHASNLKWSAAVLGLILIVAIVVPTVIIATDNEQQDQELDAPKIKEGGTAWRECEAQFFQYDHAGNRTGASGNATGVPGMGGPPPGMGGPPGMNASGNGTTGLRPPGSGGPPGTIGDNPVDPDKGLLTLEQYILRPLSSPESFNDPDSPQSRALNLTLSEVAEFMKKEDGQQKRPDRARERYVLAVLYFATGGEGWTNGRDVVDRMTHHCCNAPKIVSCSEDGHMVELNLDSNNLQGALPDELRHLRYLQRLSFANNENLEGSFPDFGSVPWTDLSELSLEGTAVVGNLESLCEACEGEECNFTADLGNVDCDCCDQEM
ncbi:hypothetical protein ACHAXT_001473 [Thalassiosira profunda]